MRPFCPRPCRLLHTSSPRPATIGSLSAHGPPPSAPMPSAEHVEIRVARKRTQAALLARAQDLRSGTAGHAAKTKRFWKDVHVRTVDDGYQIHLDARPLKTPSKQVLLIPRRKPHLATAVALEWDLLVSAHQGLRSHLIPLTSLVARALDIAREDATAAAAAPGPLRAGIVDSAMRYLDTDSLLCWAPSASPDPPGYERHASRTAKELRRIQQETAQPIIQYLTQRVWPGIAIVPVLDDGCIVPRSQARGTREVVQGWVAGLGAWELAGLERAVLAGKSLLAGARLLVEWSDGLAHLRPGPGPGPRFGIEEAVGAARLEVEWQTRMWGEVEDSHDVEKEDVRRQYGSVVLLVSGDEQVRGD